MSEQIITKRCRICKQIKPSSEFYGRQNRCKVCTRKNVRDYQKTKSGKRKHRNSNKNYQKSTKGKICQKRWSKTEHGKASKEHYDNSVKGKNARKRYRQNNPGKIKARNAIRRAIAINKIYSPNTLKCINCPDKAEEYHHPSYAPKHRLDVIPVCIKCHRKIHNKTA